MKNDIRAVLSLALAAGFVGVASADDYFMVRLSGEDVNAKRWADQPRWAKLSDPDGELCSIADLAGQGHTFWLLGGGTKIGTRTTHGKSYLDTTYANEMFRIGSPAGSPVATEQYHDLFINVSGAKGLTAKWSDGSILAWGQSCGLTGSIEVLPGTTHSLKADISNNRYLYLAGGFKLTSESENVVVQVPAALTEAGLLNRSNKYVAFISDNSSYRGSFVITTAYAMLQLGGQPFWASSMQSAKQALGDPNTPNPAALKICTHGALWLTSGIGEQCSTRGIQLTGDDAYFMGDGGTLEYPVSKAAGATGKFIRHATSGSHTLTLQGAYSAGDIEVRSGTLILGEKATFPAGQNFVVKSGATLQVMPRAGLTTYTIDKEEGGTVIFPEDWRLTNEGVWEAKVSVSVVGGGSVSETEIWAVPGVTRTLTATPDLGNFVVWSGDVTAIQGEGHDSFANTITVQVDGPVSLTATFADIVSTKPADFAEDGVTGTFADRQLTITVESGKTCTYDYASTLASGWVTNIVKKGAGALTTVAAAAYQGAFDFQEGSVTIGGAGHLGANNVGIVRKASGVTMSIAAGSATGKKMYLAGSVNQSSAATALNACDVVLTGDLTWTGGTTLNLMTDSRFDMNGKNMTITADSWGTVILNGVAFTNSSVTASTITMSWWSALHLGGGSSFWGGSRNKLITTANTATDYQSLQVTGAVGGDWTISSRGQTCFAPKDRSSNTLAYRIDCALEVYAAATKYNNANDCCLTFGGPLKGSANMNVRGGTLNFLNAANTYSGVLSMTDEKSINLRSCIYMWNGANFSASSVTLYNADIWMDDNTAFAFPAITLENGTKEENSCTITGGPTGDRPCGRATIASFTKSGGKTLTVDSPVHITGTTLISTNTLALGSGTTADELPVFDHLSFAEGTSFDMNGKNLTIADLTGIPTVTNPGTLTINGNWTVDGDAIVDGGKLDLGAGALAFGPGATITIVKGTKDIPAAAVVASATGGITGLPAVGAGGVKRGFHVAPSGTELRVNGKGMAIVVR